MAVLTVRNLPDEVHRALRLRATQLTILARRARRRSTTHLGLRQWVFPTSFGLFPRAPSQRIAWAHPREPCPPERRHMASMFGCAALTPSYAGCVANRRRHKRATRTAVRPRPPLYLRSGLCPRSFACLPRTDDGPIGMDQRSECQNRIRRADENGAVRVAAESAR